MYFTFELPEDGLELASQLKELNAAFFSAIPHTTELISSCTNPLDVDPLCQYIFRVNDGMFTLKAKERAICMLDEGDIFGVERVFSSQSLHTLHSEFGVRVDLYHIDDLLSHIAANLENLKTWTSILAKYHRLYEIALQIVARDEVDPIPSVRQFSEGEDIIAQGTSTTEIFTMVEGSADVIVDGTLIGSISGDEIFGALAAFAQTPRTATVRANQKCIVLGLPAEQFVGLMNSRPATALKLIQDMARALVASNKTVVSRL